MAEKFVPRIVSSVGTASKSADMSLSHRIETAMSQAVKDCAKEGITDPDKIRERMMTARKEARGV